MNEQPTVMHDERTHAVENAGYKWAYIFMSFGMLIDVMIRSFIFEQAAWDLLAFVVLGGAVATFHQYRQNALPQRYAKGAIIVVILSGVIAFIVAAILAAVK
ncbi:MAG: DUF6442 family protein [Candidatus Hinthialibacter antarcticus]|nr:DUF6442 family protein [Candidatus Hinthialibacter antarcticus]